MKVTLTVQEGRPRTVPVDSSEFLVGRAPDCNLQLQSPLVSRHHCALTVQDGRLYVRDLQSSNGTGLNNQTVIGERPLHNGDDLWVAATPIKVRIQGERYSTGFVDKVLRTLWRPSEPPAGCETPQASSAHN